MTNSICIVLTKRNHSNINNINIDTDNYYDNAKKDYKFQLFKIIKRA
jgi:hypothetical protein